jgi:hypothetical protein
MTMAAMVVPLAVQGAQAAVAEGTEAELAAVAAEAVSGDESDD